MILSELKGLVASFMQRDQDTFVHNGVDQLKASINMARRWAERQRNFEYCKTSVLLSSVHYQNGQALSDAVSLSDRVTPVSIKTILKAFLPFAPNGLAATDPTFPCDVISYEAHQERLQRFYQGQVSTTPSTKYITSQVNIPALATPFWSVFQWDGRLYVAPADVNALGAETVQVGLNVIKWLPAYVEDDDTDFFLDFCVDFLLMKSVYFLNLMIKEDMRVPLSEKAMATAWQTIVDWDSNIIVQSTNENSLD